jgi:hypothetical protein
MADGDTLQAGHKNRSLPGPPTAALCPRTQEGGAHARAARHVLVPCVAWREPSRRSALFANLWFKSRSRATLGNASLQEERLPALILPPSRNIRPWRVQSQEIIVRGNDFYTPHFTLPTNSPPTHQPHSILSYPSRTLYFDTKFEPSRTLYFGTEGVIKMHGLLLLLAAPLLVWID